MFGKKKTKDVVKEPEKRKGTDLMNQMGLGAIPGMVGTDHLADDDDDLEAELAELAGQEYRPAKKSKAKKGAHISIAELEQIAKADIEDHEDVSDTEDPDLLAELEELEDDEPNLIPNSAPYTVSKQSAPPPPQQQQFLPQPAAKPLMPTINPVPVPRQLPSQAGPTPAPRPVPSPTPRPGGNSGGTGGVAGVLEERLSMYKQASAAAKTAGDSSKQRRLDRGIKTLADLLRQAKSGKPISEEDIPPPVAMGSSVALEPSASATQDNPPSMGQPSNAVSPPKASGNLPVSASAVPLNNTKQMLLAKRDEYKKAALMAKQSGDMAKAGSYIKIAKQFDNVIQAVDEGKNVDLSQMPPGPEEVQGPAVRSGFEPQINTVVQRSSNQAAGEETEPELPTVSAEQEKAIFNAPDAPKTVMEALTQRLEKYKSSESSAKSEGDSGKARRMGRIVKQYEDAIKMYRGGKPVDFDELPTPPGYAPIPQDKPSPASSAPQPRAPAPSAAPPVAQKPATSPAAAARPAVANKPVTAPAVAARPGAAQGSAASHQPGPSSAPIQRQNTGRKSLHSRQEQQLAFLKERMEEFKQAAMNAKKNHDIELAKKHIRMMKGLEPMIEACESGLPVELSQVPDSPFAGDAEDKFVIVSAEDCHPTGDREEVYKYLTDDLIRQIGICVTNAQHYKKLGDVPAASKFEKLEQNNRRDLESLKSAQRHGDPAPKFHYETKTFSMVQSNTDLGDADLELTIVRGIQYNLPSGSSEKDMDTCVKYEFAYPTEQPQTGGTATVKNTINPEYNETFRLQINRASKGLFRFVERKSIKLDVFIKRGFFKGDKLLGTVNVKLQPLEDKCIIHESYDLMEGRKTVGGKLEVKIRLRDPLKNKQVDEVKEKWLVIDQFIRTVGSKSQAEVKAPKTHSEGTICMEVLRFEKQMLDKQIFQLKDSLSVSQTQALKHKSALIEEKLELQQKKLREGGIEAWKAYLAAVQKEAIGLEQEARQFAKLGDVHKAEMFMNKKKHAEKEMAAVRAKIPSA